ncbi:NAD(P)-dependent oxidoreductase [Parenemella sanctibonifatiensis]|uniref:3-hydroxyisobutyrate dehydrogenase n=1 Tax=Parenemella sanctibonifatiensis TaxID=2016505 RepID=A0A255EEK2_9ACTN|nr:NAD(P)-dependent oxidoreductase [Parenemella sanctibonifatiensis]OYN89361.1 3-hydroxyisobutyrate dehydrogenase [Parenemella sanctibonifatiensis]
MGLIGPGRMGAPMASNILAGGLGVHVMARRPEAAAELVDQGATVAARAADLPAACATVLAVLPDLPQLQPLLEGPDGLYAGAAAHPEPTVLVICSTSSPQGVRDLAAEAAEATNGQLRVVDAPISGGEVGAQNAQLAIMVGGAEEDIQQVLPALAHCGTPTVMGALGSGEVAKACGQLIVAATMAAVAEASVLAESAGLDISALMDALGAGLADSRLLQQKRDKIVNRDYSTTGALAYMRKDLGFASQEAAVHGTELQLTEKLREMYGQVVDAGLGEQDLAVIHHFLREQRSNPTPEHP